MSQKLTRVFTVLIAGLLTLGLLLGGTYAYNKLAFTKPLEANVTKLPAIGSFKIEKLNSQAKVTVQFKVKEKLRTSFYQMLDQLKGQSGSKFSNLTVEVANTPNEQLARFLTDSKLPIYEAVSTGKFTSLPQNIGVLADRQQVKYDLEVDSNFIFLTATVGDQTADLIISRGNTAALQVVNTMGGEYL